MSTDLYSTPTCLALLRDIADPTVKVYRHREFSTGKVVSTLERYRNSDRYVTARADEMYAAGWITLGSKSSPSWYARQDWSLTDLGRQVLAKHGTEA